MNVKNYARARLNWLRLAAVFCLLTGFVPEVAAQPSGGGTVLNHSGFIRGVDVAYDAGTGGFFVVGGQGHVIGQCVNADGNAIGPMITINNTGFGAFPRARFSPRHQRFSGGVEWRRSATRASSMRAHRNLRWWHGTRADDLRGPQRLDRERRSDRLLTEQPEVPRCVEEPVPRTASEWCWLTTTVRAASGVVTVSTGFAPGSGRCLEPEHERIRRFLQRRERLHELQRARRGSGGTTPEPSAARRSTPLAAE